MQQSRAATASRQLLLILSALAGRLLGTSGTTELLVYLSCNINKAWQGIVNIALHQNLRHSHGGEHTCK